MRQPYTVLGYWEDSGERHGQEIEAESAVHAEQLMAEQAEREGGQFRAAATLRGTHDVIDRYTGFIYPDDPRNEERADLQPAIDELFVTEYTVIGLVVSNRPGDEAWIGARAASDSSAMRWRFRPGSRKTSRPTTYASVARLADRVRRTGRTEGAGGVAPLLQPS